MVSSEPDRHDFENHLSALEMLERWKDPDGPWMDRDMGLSLGFIVRLLEECLDKVHPDEQKGDLCWRVFDHNFGNRPDWILWRKARSPAFWKVGRSKDLFYRPRATEHFEVTAGVFPPLEDLIPEFDKFLAAEPTVRLGILGTIADCARQERAGRRQNPEEPPVTPINSSVSPIQTRRTASFANDYLSLCGTTPCQDTVQAALDISLIGLMREHFSDERWNEIVSFLKARIDVLDPRFDVCGVHKSSKNGLPVISLRELNERDVFGQRFVPAHSEDQLFLLCDAIREISELLKRVLLEFTTTAAISHLHIARVRSSLLAACAYLLRLLRIGHETRAKKAGLSESDRRILYVRERELEAFFSAAMSAEQADRPLLAAALWSTYQWTQRTWDDFARAPVRTYLAIAEAGFLQKEGSRAPRSEARRVSIDLATPGGQFS